MLWIKLVWIQNNFSASLAISHVNNMNTKGFISLFSYRTWKQTVGESFLSLSSCLSLYSDWWRWSTTPMLFHNGSMPPNQMTRPNPREAGVYRCTKPVYPSLSTRVPLTASMAVDGIRLHTHRLPLSSPLFFSVFITNWRRLASPAKQNIPNASTRLPLQFTVIGWVLYFTARHCEHCEHSATVTTS